MHQVQLPKDHRVKAAGKSTSSPGADANSYFQNMCSDLAITGCFSVDQGVFDKCNLLLIIFFQMHIIFPGNYNDTVECSKGYKVEFLLFSSFGISLLS